MKKWIYIVAFALLLTGCGSKSEGTAESNAVEEETSQGTINSSSSGENGYDVIQLEDFKSFFTITELTTDNWEHYLEIYEDEEIGEDAFGEPNGEREVDERVRLKDGIALWGDEIVMRFQVTYTGESGNYDQSGSKVSGEEPYEANDEIDAIITFRKSTIVDEMLRENPNPDDATLTFRVTRDISSIECTKIQGSVWEGNIPDDVWIEENGERFIAVDDGEGSYYKLYDTGISEHFSPNGGSTTEEVASSDDMDELPAFARWSMLKKLLSE